MFTVAQYAKKSGVSRNVAAYRLSVAERAGTVNFVRRMESGKWAKFYWLVE